MKFVKIYSEETIAGTIKKREGETKLGEEILFLKANQDLEKSSALYVILGIPEDIGVRANYGNSGTSEAFQEGIKSFLNIQKNEFFNPDKILLLGEIDCNKQMEQAEALDKKDTHFAEKLGELVIQIDHKVSAVIEAIVGAGKIPIIIGGGHNNSFGNIKGTATALKKPINCINFDAHSDFRALEHRHSGNGFSYAFEEGFLGKYFIFGLQRNYTSEGNFKTLQKNSDRIKYALFEDICFSEENTFKKEIQNAEAFSCDSEFGLEIDMDAIENMGSSAMSPSGFTVNQTRHFIRYFSKNKNCRYIHICEGSPKAGIFENQVGKAISYFISDIVSK